MFGRYKFTKAAYDGDNLALCSSVVSGQKAVFFVEAFPALPADVSSFFEEKIYRLTECRAVPDTLHSIIMNTICRPAAARTFVTFEWKLYVYFKLSFIEHTSFLSV